jgi:hypothetical protein
MRFHHKQKTRADHAAQSNPLIQTHAPRTLAGFADARGRKMPAGTPTLPSLAVMTKSHADHKMKLQMDRTRNQ